MDGKKVGTVVGFVWAPYLQKWSAAGAALFPDQVTVAKALLNGHIQGYVNGGFIIHAPPFNDDPNVVEHPLDTEECGAAAWKRMAVGTE